MAAPIVLQEVPIAAAIRQMARHAAGIPEPEEKKKGFSFFSKFRSSPKQFHDTVEPEEIRHPTFPAPPPKIHLRRNSAPPLPIAIRVEYK